MLVVVDHLHQNLFGVLKALEKRWLFDLKVDVATRRGAQGYSLHRGSFGVNESDLATAAAKNELR